MSDTRHPDPLK